MSPTLKIILRVIHVLAGVYWAGGTFYLVTLVAPIADDADVEGSKFMSVLAPKSGIITGIAGLLSLVTGIILYLYTSGFIGAGIDALAAWAKSFTGASLTIGALVAIFAFFYGGNVQRVNTDKFSEFAKKIATEGGSPSPEQLTQLKILRDKNNKGAQFTAILFVVVVITMAAAGV